MKIFEGKNAVVIGGSGGIGLAVSSMLSAAGANVVIHGRNADKLKKAVQQAQEQGKKGIVSSVMCELNAGSLSELNNTELWNAVKNADILAVCYGPFIQKPLEKTTPQDWQNTALLDYALPGMLVSLSLNNMIKNKWGRILLFGGTGTSFRNEFKTNAAYAGAKAGIGVLVQSVAASYSKEGITCNAILPGFVETEYISEELKDELKNKTCDGQLIKSETIAKAAEFLLSSPELNGVLLRVDKGWSPVY